MSSDIQLLKATCGHHKRLHDGEQKVSYNAFTSNINASLLSLILSVKDLCRAIEFLACVWSNLQCQDDLLSSKFSP